MEPGGSLATERIIAHVSVDYEGFQDIADGLHFCLMRFKTRVTDITLASNSTFSATGKHRCFERHLGIPRSENGWVVSHGSLRICT
jgi:hypothetical protein